METAIITGGGSGIGQALAWEMAARSVHVTVIGRQELKLLTTQERFPDKIEIITADISSEQGCQKVIGSFAQSKIDYLIHNAGIIEPIASLQQVGLKDWRKTFAINVDATLVLAQGLYQQLQGGRVLNISSGAAHHSIPSWAAYCSSKAALFMLYQCWNAEQDDVAFGSVMPGIVDTNMQTTIRDSDSMPDANHDFFKQLKQQDRLIPVSTVAHFLTWLLMDTSLETFKEKEWDIYQQWHHAQWMQEADEVPELD